MVCPFGYQLSCKHLQLRKQANRLGIDGNYFRFDVPQGMSKIGLEEWEKIGDMIALTKDYMDHWDWEAKETAAQRLLDPNITS
jgi:hypothetical protein